MNHEENTIEELKTDTKKTQFCQHITITTQDDGYVSPLTNTEKKISERRSRAEAVARQQIISFLTF